jgi:hypothetical protein
LIKISLIQITLTVSPAPETGCAYRRQHMPRLPVPPRDVSAATPDDPRWAAVAARESGHDGSFVYSVATTGVYCRPSCPARPKRENVGFHATRAEAEAAGFRPCKRCKPRGEPLP